MKSLPRIPTPASLYWREFRIRFVPVIMFCVVMAGIVFTWRHAGLNGAIPGVAEGVRSTLTSPQLGIIQQLRVQPYQIVEAGQPIAVLVPTDPRGQVDLLMVELQLARMRAQPTLAEDNAMNFERIRIELLRMRTEVAIAKINFDRTDREVRRQEPLVKKQLVSEDLYEIAVGERDAFKAEFEEKSKAVAQIEKRLEELSRLGVPQSVSTDDPYNKLLARLEGMKSATHTNWNPITLVAPISGMVNFIYRHQGENVVEGEPILTINSVWSDRIVGYMRQPFPFAPRVGMEVTVTTRDGLRQEFQSEITQIGAHIEMITNSLAYMKVGALVDSGLPIIVSLPPGQNVRPGEIVDLMIRPKREEAVQVPKANTQATVSSRQVASTP